MQHRMHKKFILFLYMFKMLPIKNEQFFLALNKNEFWNSRKITTLLNISSR